MGRTQEIHKVCLSGDIVRFNGIIRLKNFSINTRDNLNFTPLMCASFSGSKEIVKKLLKMDKILINARSRNKKTALSCCTCARLRKRERCGVYWS